VLLCFGAELNTLLFVRFAPLLDGNVRVSFPSGTIIKRQAHNNFAGLFYGLAFTKPNKDFTKMVKSKFSPESKLLVVCQEGLR
jgi:hypothetical protein